MSTENLSLVKNVDIDLGPPKPPPRQHRKGKSIIKNVNRVTISNNSAGQINQIKSKSSINSINNNNRNNLPSTSSSSSINSLPKAPVRRTKSALIRSTNRSTSLLTPPSTSSMSTKYTKSESKVNKSKLSYHRSKVINDNKSQSNSLVKIGLLSKSDSKSEKEHQESLGSHQSTSNSMLTTSHLKSTKIDATNRIDADSINEPINRKEPETRKPWTRSTGSLSEAALLLSATNQSKSSNRNNIRSSNNNSRTSTSSSPSSSCSSRPAASLTQSTANRLNFSVNNNHLDNKLTDCSDLVFESDQDCGTSKSSFIKQQQLVNKKVTPVSSSKSAKQHQNTNSLIVPVSLSPSSSSGVNCDLNQHQQQDHDKVDQFNGCEVDNVNRGKHFELCDVNQLKDLNGRVVNNNSKYNKENSKLTRIENKGNLVPGRSEINQSVIGSFKSIDKQSTRRNNNQSLDNLENSQICGTNNIDDIKALHNTSNGKNVGKNVRKENINWIGQQQQLNGTQLSSSTSTTTETIAATVPSTSSSPNKNKLYSIGSQLPKTTVKSVKRIGIFYSDLCDVIKGMRTSNITNPSSQPQSQHQQQSHQHDGSNNPENNGDHVNVADGDGSAGDNGNNTDPNQYQQRNVPIMGDTSIETNPSSPGSPVYHPGTLMDSSNLPDILNSHLPPPPPYSTLPPPNHPYPRSPVIATGSSIGPPLIPPPPPSLPNSTPSSMGLVCPATTLTSGPPGRPPLPSRRILGPILASGGSGGNNGGGGNSFPSGSPTAALSFANNNYLSPSSSSLPTAASLPPHSSSHHHHHVNHTAHPYLRPGCSRESDAETSTTKSCLTCSGLSIRWFILLISFIGLVCTIIGTFLGAARPTGKEHLTLALLMIGVGVVLIIVSGIAWRLTSTGPTWRALFGFADIPTTVGLNGSTLESTSRRFLPRVPVPHGRSGAHHHPYGAMFYPEFQYRPPPPSYQASMQEYRLRLLLLERSSSHPQPTSLSPVSPPPTYRSSAASSLAGTLNRAGCNTIQRPISRPPSYRSIIDQSQVNSMNNNTLNGHSNNNSIGHPIYSSPRLTNTTSSNASQQAPNTGSTSSFKDDVNRITIHQTNTTSTVCTPHGVNIVAITPLAEPDRTTSMMAPGHLGLTALPTATPTATGATTLSTISIETTTTLSDNLLTNANGTINNSNNSYGGPGPGSVTGNSEVQILAHV